MKDTESIIKFCCHELKSNHQCHTVILYGSFARGDAGPFSDFDLVGFSAQASSKMRDARIYADRFLDLFIFPPSEYEHTSSSHLYMRNGKVLYDEFGKGSEFLKSLEKIYNLGPEKLPDDEKQARRVWVQKMIARAKVDDLEGRFRLTMLKSSILEDYFLLRDQWYLGSKESFSWLRKNDPKLFHDFEKIFQPDASLQDLESLASVVYR